MKNYEAIVHYFMGNKRYIESLAVLNDAVKLGETPVEIRKLLVEHMIDGAKNLLTNLEELNTGLNFPEDGDEIYRYHLKKEETR